MSFLFLFCKIIHCNSVVTLLLTSASSTGFLCFASRALINITFQLPSYTLLVQMFLLDSANACCIFITWLQRCLLSEAFPDSSFLLILQDSAHNHYIVASLITRPRSPQRENPVLVPATQKCSVNVCRIASVTLSWFWKQPTSWHTMLCATQSCQHSRGSEFMLTLLTYHFTPSSIFSQSSLVSRVAQLAGSLLLCANFATLGSVTIPRRPPWGRAHAVSQSSRTLC